MLPGNCPAAAGCFVMFRSTPSRRGSLREFNEIPFVLGAFKITLPELSFCLFEDDHFTITAFALQETPDRGESPARRVPLATLAILDRLAIRDHRDIRDPSVRMVNRDRRERPDQLVTRALHISICLLKIKDA